MKKNTKIIIWSGVGLAAIGVLVYVRYRNKKEVEELTKLIGGSLTQNNLSTLSNEIVKSIEDTPLTSTNLLVDNIPSSNPVAFKAALMDVVLNLNKAVSSWKGTDVPLFGKNLARIKNKATMKFADTFYKTMYGETLMQAIQGETALYTGPKVKFIIDPFGILAKDLPSYHPAIVKYFAGLK